MRMSSDEYAAFVDSLSPRSPIWGDLLRAGLVGGAICVVGQALVNLYEHWGASAATASTWCSITLVFLGALLTGLGVYDDLARFAGAGSLVPITGFANSVVSPALEFKTEGFVTGTAVKIFTIAGPVIVYGISASVIYGLILAVFDGSEPLTREDLVLAQRCAGRPAIALVNKEDKPTRFDAEIIAGDFAMVLPVCCQEEGSRKVIAAAVARLLGTNQIDPHAASLSGQRQLAAATRARDAVAGALDAVEGGFGLDAVSVCVDDALDALCELTGENASEAVINEVFERFCVGK